MARTPTHAINEAVQGAFDRMNTSLNGTKGADATRQRKAVRTLQNIADRLGDTQQIPREPPPQVQRTPTTEMDRRILRLFKAVQALATWRFDTRTPLREHDIRAAFDEIV